jgi:lysophospholipase L1-like esterase
MAEAEGTTANTTVVNWGRRVSVALVVAVVLLATAGMVWWIGDDDSDAPPPPRPVTLPDSSPRYVVLGDSYSAGEGLRPFLPDTVDLPEGDRCHRSEASFSHRLVFDPPATTDFRACSGATLEHLYEEVQTHRHKGRPNPVSLGPQAKDVLGEDVGLVTLTMGGNDVAFARVVRFCAERRSCVNAAFREAPSLEDWADRALDGLAAKLPVVYGDLREEAPNARIIVVGYPQLFSAQPSNASRCAIYRTLFSSREREVLNKLALRLNRIIEDAAVEAGLEYLDISYIFNGHETCGRHGAWLQFLGVDPFFQQGNFHPNRTGQRMIARAIACYLTVEHEPADVADDEMSTPTTPSGDTPTEELQQPTSDRANGDLGDRVYECVSSETTTDDLDRRDPPVVSPQPYPLQDSRG